MAKLSTLLGLLLVVDLQSLVWGKYALIKLPPQFAKAYASQGGDICSLILSTESAGRTTVTDHATQSNSVWHVRKARFA
jgi:hypothetical protein